MKLPVLIDKMVSEKELPTNFLRFYIVGFLLFAIPYTRALFFNITALSILLVVAAIFLHHKRWNMSTIVVFSVIAIGSFFLEVAGVATGTIFGHYSYDESLGVKLFDAPLLIGINWVYLIYASQAIIAKMTNNVFVLNENMDIAGKQCITAYFRWGIAYGWLRFYHGTCCTTYANVAF